MASGGHGGGHGHGGGGHKHHEEHEEHEEHVNHEAWVIPYADMLTLLMVMFLALFAVSRVDLDKFKKLAENMREEFGGGGSAQMVTVGSGGSGSTPMQGGNGIFDGAVPPKVGGEPTEMQVEKARQDYEKKVAEEAVGELQDFQAQLTSKSNIAGLGQGLDFTLEGRGLVVTVVSDAVLFAPGSAAIEPEGMEVLGIIAEALRMIPNDVVIEGHTDSRPISNSRFPSNWELSTDRANAVLRYLIGAGIDMTRLSAGGYGETRPKDTNDTPEGRATNRRVEIVVLTDVSLEPILPDAVAGGAGGGAGEGATDGGADEAAQPAVEP